MKSCLYDPSIRCVGSQTRELAPPLSMPRIWYDCRSTLVMIMTRMADIIRLCRRWGTSHGFMLGNRSSVSEAKCNSPVRSEILLVINTVSDLEKVSMTGLYELPLLLPHLNVMILNNSGTFIDFLGLWG